MPETIGTWYYSLVIAMLFFLNPLFLWGLAALSIPLVLHLFQRRRTVVIPFPTLRFLKLAQKRSSSRIRFENLILWLLRSLLLALLTLAFAMPVLRKSSAGNWLARSRRDVVIVIDTSYSMAYETDRGAVIETARTAAAGLVESLAPGDRVCVYLAADTPQPLIERPTTEHAAVLQALRGIAWRHGSSSIDAAIAQALHTLDQERDARLEREIYVLTDGQALPWHGFRTAPDDPAAPANRKAWATLCESETPMLVAFSDGDPITGAMAPVFQRAMAGAHGIVAVGGYLSAMATLTLLALLLVPRDAP